MTTTSTAVDRRCVYCGKPVINNYICGADGPYHAECTRGPGVATPIPTVGIPDALRTKIKDLIQSAWTHGFDAERLNEVAFIDEFMLVDEALDEYWSNSKQQPASADHRAQLWDCINEYAEACGGRPGAASNNKKKLRAIIALMELVHHGCVDWHAIASDLATALERLDDQYRSEQDPEAPLNRPNWLTKPLQRYHRALEGKP